MALLVSIFLPWTDKDDVKYDDVLYRDTEKFVHTSKGKTVCVGQLAATPEATLSVRNKKAWHAMGGWQQEEKITIHKYKYVQIQIQIHI